MREELTNLRRFYGDHVPTLLEARHEYAVLCPLVERPDGLHLLFEVRSAGVSQSGETCFPGGQMEPGETPADCALRETEEELSIPRAEIRLLGQGDFICNQRGFLLRPCRVWSPLPVSQPCVPPPLRWRRCSPRR